MKVWVTKHLFTEGVQEVEVAQGYTLQVVYGPAPNNTVYIGEGRDWHKTREDAITRAENMRKEKIRSLREKIGQLEKLKFK